MFAMANPAAMDAATAVIPFRPFLCPDPGGAVAMSSSSHVRHFEVPGGSDGLRLDRFLADCGAAGSRERVRSLIKNGSVTVNGGLVYKPSHLLQPGDVTAIQIEDVPSSSTLEPVEAPLDIRFEDSELLVVNKPRGLAVHPGAGTKSPTLVQMVLAHTELSPVGAPSRPGVVHRIDKDTSGLLVFAKTERAHHFFASRFAEHAIDRIYDGVVWGAVGQARGTIESSLGRHPAHRTRFASVRQGGRRAVTHWKRVAVRGPVSHLRFKLETGRTHQIRVHAAELGHPLVGDPVYGWKRLPEGLSGQFQRAVQALRGQALHAGVLGFTHPVTGKGLRFETPMPEDMLEVLQSAGI